MSSAAIVVELRVGRASPRGLRLVPGRRVPAFSVGRRGAWCIEASGVADVAAHLEFDGENLLVIGTADGNALLDGRLVGRKPMVVSPPAVLAIGDARLLIDRDDRSDDVAPGESILGAAAETTSGTRVMPLQVTRLMPMPTTRIMPIETLIAERRSEATEKAFFEVDAASPSIPSRPDRMGGHEAAAGEDHSEATERLSARSAPDPGRRRTKLRVVVAVLTAALVIGVAVLSVRAGRHHRAEAAALRGSTSEPPGSNGVGQEPAGSAVPAVAGTVPAAPPAAAQTGPAAAPVASDVGGVAPSAAIGRSAIQVSNGSRSASQRASAERLAVDLVAAGDYAQAARAYDNLASSHASTPAASTFREAARILRARPVIGAQVR